MIADIDGHARAIPEWELMETAIKLALAKGESMSSVNAWLFSLDIYKKHYGNKFIKRLSNTYLCQQSRFVLDAGQVPKRGLRRSGRFSEETVCFVQLPLSGVLMEHVKEAIEEIRGDIKKSQETLQQSYNELLKMHDLFSPQIVKMSKQLREKRTALLTEVKLSMTLFKDIRKFFIEKEHKTEINNIKEFAEVCERVKKLIDDGTMDAITDAILKLEGVKDGKEEKGDRKGR